MREIVIYFYFSLISFHGFDNQDNAVFIKQIGKHYIFFYLSEVFVYSWCYFLLKYLDEVTWVWNFLHGKVSKYESITFNRYSVPVICFFLSEPWLLMPFKSFIRFILVVKIFVTRLFVIRYSRYLLNVYRVYNDVSFFIADISTLCPLSLLNLAKFC